jgi:5-methylcytosine-specific restriction endonuclease McrA
MKTCKICGKAKNFAQFSKHSASKNGVGPYCIDCNRERGRVRYQQKRDFLIEQQRLYRQNNYDRRIEVEREARKRNREKYRISRNERQLRRARVEKERTYLILPKEIKKLYNDPCFVCGSTENQSIDHIIPLSRGGNHSIGNLMTLCRSCNASKHARFMVEWYKARNST